MRTSNIVVFLIVLLLNISFITSQTNYKTLTLNEVHTDSVTESQIIQYSLSYYEYDDELITVTVLQLTPSNTLGNITFCVGYIEDDHIITLPSNSSSTPSSADNTTTTPPSNTTSTPSSTENTNTNTTTTPSSSLDNNTNTTTNNNTTETEESVYDVYVCSVPGQQTLILPHLPHSHLRSENITLYINVTTTSNTTDPFTISASPVLEALSDVYKVAENRYIITGSVKSGLRQYYHYHPSSTSQSLQIESCGSEDISGNNNPIWGAFLFNRTDDHWQLDGEYNQTLVDHPCGLQNNGNFVSINPQNNQTNDYLFICPSYVITSGPFDDHSYFAIDVLLYRFLQKNGTLNYRVVIDTNSSLSVPLSPANQGNPSQIYNANFSIKKSEMDAVVSFDQITASDGSFLPDIQYALFSDYAYSKQEVQYLKANTSLSSSCYLLSHQEKMIISSWFPNNQLTLVDNSTRASFVVKDFYTTYDNRTFEVNLVGYSHTKGSFAYTYQSVDTTIHYNLPIGISVLIVIGSIVATIAVFLVLGVIGYFAYIKYQNRSKYELL